jgi:CIC family chloride channel protein
MPAETSESTPLLKRFLHRRTPLNNLSILIVAAAVGACAALAATGLNLALEYLGNLRVSYTDRWWMLFLPAIGATLAVVLSRRIFHESGAHGVGEIIASVGLKKGVVKPIAMISALVTCLLTISSGGSAGPEAPVVVSGSSMGSNLARLFRMSGQSRMTLVGCGAAGSISAIFNAPVTGMIFAVEIILGEWTPYNLVPIAISSVVATEVARILTGNVIPFGETLPHMGIVDLQTSVLLALGASIISVFFVRSIRLSGSLATKITSRPWLRACLGGLAVGIIGLWFPDALGEGYSSIRHAITGSFQPGIALMMVMLISRIATTSFTLGSGGPGGIFAPCLVIGSLFGVTFHRMVQPFMSADISGEGSYALLGMAGIVSGVMQAPLTSTFLVLEITNDYHAVIHVMIAAFLSSTLTHIFEPTSFYFKDLVEKGMLIRPKTDARILTDINPQDLIRSDLVTSEPDMSVQTFIKLLQSSYQTHIPIIEKDTGSFKGMVDVIAARASILNPDRSENYISEIALDQNAPQITMDMGAAEIIEIMEKSDRNTLPVVENGKFKGIITKGDILNAYRKELKMASQQDHLF